VVVVVGGRGIVAPVLTQGVFLLLVAMDCPSGRHPDPVAHPCLFRWWSHVQRCTEGRSCVRMCAHVSPYDDACACPLG
jgi:hypothetical protein